MEAQRWVLRGAALLLLAALWVACGDDEQTPGDGAGAAGTGGSSGPTGAGGGTAGAGGAGLMVSEPMGGSGGSSSVAGSNQGVGGSAGATSSDPTCALACQHATTCLTNGTLCPELSAQDANAISIACRKICALMGADFESLAEHADRCGLALTLVVDNADRVERPNRDVLERCAPSEACEGACDTVGVCAADNCENLGAVGGVIFSACMDPCAGDEAWINSVNSAQDATGCSGSLDAFEAARPGILPAGCAAQN